MDHIFWLNLLIYHTNKHPQITRLTYSFHLSFHQFYMNIYLLIYTNVSNMINLDQIYKFIKKAFYFKTNDQYLVYTKIVHLYQIKILRKCQNSSHKKSNFQWNFFTNKIIIVLRILKITWNNNYRKNGFKIFLKKYKTNE